MDPYDHAQSRAAGGERRGAATSPPPGTPLHTSQQQQSASPVGDESDPPEVVPPPTTVEDAVDEIAQQQQQQQQQDSSDVHSTVHTAPTSLSDPPSATAGHDWFSQEFLQHMAAGFLDATAQGAQHRRPPPTPPTPQGQQQTPPRPDAMQHATMGRATLQPDDAPASEAQSATPTTLYYHLPFSALDGRRALLAIPGNFLPILEVPDPSDTAPPTQTDGQSRQRTRVTVMAPADPVFVPLGSSTLPFSFLYNSSGWAWPVISLQNPPPGVRIDFQTSNDPRNPHFVAGPPFPLFMANGGGGGASAAETQDPPSPKKAQTFADGLEVADEELRSRMARLGIGDIGAFGGGGEIDAGQLGCPVCLDPYDESSDRPEWIGGQEARDNQVVVIPCSGFHSMHRRCLVEWLSTKGTRQWTCPMCRSSITPGHLIDKNRNGGERDASAAPTSEEALASAIEARSHSLREEIHRRERQRGFMCDYQACFPDYAEGGELGTATPIDLDRLMVKLSPCGHSLHRDCLTTSLRVSRSGIDLVGSTEDSDDEVNDATDADIGRGYKLIGKWVECPVDRKEVWAQIPVALPKRHREADSAVAPAPPPQCGQVHRLSSSPPVAKRLQRCEDGVE